ncbi:hypothetical protein [Streptomyces sp. DG1A-41]|uniref:GntT/GntP/DsdX family permease n=1 Tax=Streptomyces sp. DG1A-41 TaxID=3125779 RepID=UPI0030D1FD35
MGSALPPAAMVILVAGAGGVFGKVLVASGVGDVIAGVLERTGLPVLLMAFLTSLALRAAQGSATVALVTAAGIPTPCCTAPTCPPVSCRWWSWRWAGEHSRSPTSTTPGTGCSPSSPVST